MPQNERDFFTDLRAIRDCTAPCETKHLLLVLMTFCRQDQCWPSVETIAGCLGLGIRATQIRIQEAIQLGWLKVEMRGRSVNRYTLNVDKAVAEQAGSGAQQTAQAQPVALPKDPHRAQQSAPEAQPIARRAQPTTPRTTNELPDEQPKGVVALFDNLFPTALDRPEFKTKWGEWMAYRRERRLPKYVPRSEKAQLNRCAHWGIAAATGAIELAIANGWNSIVDPTEKRGPASNGTGYGNKPTKGSPHPTNPHLLMGDRDWYDPGRQYPSGDPRLHMAGARA